MLSTENNISRPDEKATPPYFDIVASVANTSHNKNVSGKVLYYFYYLT